MNFLKLICILFMFIICLMAIAMGIKWLFETYSHTSIEWWYWVLALIFLFGVPISKK
jgi:hypothetical protein